VSDLSVGDVDILYLDVTPAAGDTAGALTVNRPDGTSAVVPVTPGPVTGDPAVRRLTADAVTFTMAGRWVFSWTVTGTGVGAEDIEVWVAAPPIAGGPTWTPGLSRVAAYIPRLTVDQTAPGSAVELGTFDGRTNPTGEIAQRHINDAVAEVAALAGTVPAGFDLLAAAIAARRAAATILRAYGDDRAGQDTIAVAAALDARADADLTRLRAAIDALEPDDPDEFSIAPVYTFPAPAPWGDLLI
jgi:hypothetical protein